MKQIILAAFAVVALTHPASAQSLTDGHGPDAWAVTGVVQGDVLNLRAGPSTDYPRIGRLTADAGGVEMLVCVPTLTYEQFQTLKGAGHKLGPRWCLVQLGDERGWANAHYLAENTGQGGARTPTGDAPIDGPEAALPAMVTSFVTQWIGGEFHRRPGSLRSYVSPDLDETLMRDTGADALFDAQDYDITNLDVRWGEVPVYRGLASLVATYRNFGQPERLEFGLTRLPGAASYVIIDIAGPIRE